MRKTIIAAALAAAAAGALPAAAHADQRCVNPRTNATTGALVGAAGGAAVGSVLAGRHDRGKGAVLGALGGALLGGAIGNNQTRCPDGYYAYDDQTRQYYDNNGAVYDPRGAYDAGPAYNNGGPPPPPGAYDRGPGYGPPPPAGAYDNGPAYGGGGGGYYGGAPTSVRERLDWAERRVNRSIERGRLNPREADDARRDLQDIRAQYYSMVRRGPGGGALNSTDARYINGRLDRLAQNVRWDSNDRY